MALKSWQTNKKNNAPQKKGQGKEKPAAKKPANEKQTQHTEPRPELATSPATPTLATTELAEPHTSEEPAGQIYEPAETAGAAVEMQALPAEEVEIEPMAPGADDTVPANEPEAEAMHAEPVTTAQLAAESSPAQPAAAATAFGAEAEMMAATEETQAAEHAPAEHASIVEATVATEQPAAAPNPAPSASTDAGPMPTPASKEPQPRERDPRLPPPGTVLQRCDRHGNVRCECTVEQDGIRYAGKLYKSLSAAAIAATKDMGLKSKTQNGRTFWGVATPAICGRTARSMRPTSSAADTES
jgi:hypothetical protein